MKIGILTFPNSISFGAVLQMFALQHRVKMLGHQVEVINYHNRFMKNERHCIGKSRLRTLARRILHGGQYRRFLKFEKKMGLFPKKAISTPEKLAELSSRYDAVICGSDQVWNPEITGGDMSYFLDFCGDSVRRISYAPSFGVESLEAGFAARAAKELEKFSGVSVREEQGCRLVREMTGSEPELVADPTLLLTPDEWLGIEEPWPVPAEGYILQYTVRGSESLSAFSRRLSEKTGLKVIIVGGNRFRRHGERELFASDITPGQWLYLMRNAEYVVTNSFHGTAFSINFRKDFFVEFSSRTNSRLSHIVTAMGLESRVLAAGVEAVTDSVDYTLTDAVLPQLREESLGYLIHAIEGEK